LIENRDEYLEHSSRNYTIAQKQFNNLLTERLLQVAEKHGYAFDPDEFNFVAIRDRIRCYYKSYVQTVRKRGLPLPGLLGNKSESPLKKRKTDGGEDGDGDEDHDVNDDDGEEHRDGEDHSKNDDEKENGNKHVEKYKSSPTRESSSDKDKDKNQPKGTSSPPRKQ